MRRQPAGLPAAAAAGPSMMPDVGFEGGPEVVTEEAIINLGRTTNASHWCIILHHNKEEETPPMHLFPAEALVGLFQQGKLFGVTLVAGIRTMHKPKMPLPAPFFRTLEYILQSIACNFAYRPITDKDLAKGYPPAGWSRVPVISPADEAAGAGNAGPATGAGGNLAQATSDPIRVLAQAGCWCYVSSYHVTASTCRFSMCLGPDVLARQFKANELSPYTLLGGVYEARPKERIRMPPAMMLPLGALFHLYRSGRQYLPLTVAELREARSSLVPLFVGRNTKPLPLAQQIDLGPVATADQGSEPAAPVIPGLTPVDNGRVPASGVPPRAAPANAPAQPRPAAAGMPGAGINGAGPAAAAAGTNAGDANAAGFVRPAPFPDAEAQTSVSFLGDNTLGCRNLFETSPLRLFLGQRAQYALGSHWWYVDATNNICGPYSSEQMLLAYLASKELDLDSLLCGCIHDAQPAQVPPAACFEKLGDLLQAMDTGGIYMCISRHEIANTGVTAPSRVRYAPATPATGPATYIANPPGVAAAIMNKPPMLPHALGTAAFPPVYQQFQPHRPAP